MRRQGGIWEELISFPNLLRAAQKAARGKRARSNVARFHLDLEGQLCRLQDELIAKTYLPGQYRTFAIHEPKARTISAAPYRDRVVHHGLCQVLEPAFERRFIFDSYACRKGKGTHAALARFTQFARRNRYVLKCDVRRYFPSIDHEILKGQVRRRIKDRDALWLVDLIVDHSNPQEPVCDWFPGDNLLTPSERRRGLPIGNQTSQFFANVYLDPLDHYVKERLRARYYIRYVDDFVVFGDDKEWLSDVRDRCAGFARGLRLALHERKCVISRTCDGTRFLGFRVFPTHRLLARENVARTRRRLRWLGGEFAAGHVSAADVSRRIMSWIGHAQHGDTFRLRSRLFRENTFSRKGE